ncbi:hypothetical protein [Dyella psychrodurans]|uniref:hypothetical protein n=1 Tax=Dyella psychrodurans TaxID=1927960 RepID=UPI0011C02A19|nr:hypothetical protein [Dyella psychrodurans]
MKRMLLLVALLLFAMPLSCLATGDSLGVIVVSKKCGDAEMSLRCLAIHGGKLDCLHPSLMLKDGSGRYSKMATPKGMEKLSPVGLACSVSSKNALSYFVVEYGELPAGCEYCEWFHIYDTHGKLLTSSYPSVLNIEGMEPPRDKAPNNIDFTSWSKKLGLGKSEEEYLQCDGDPLDANGNPVCFKEL